MMWMDERVWPRMKSECCEEAELWWGYADMKVVRTLQVSERSLYSMRSVLQCTNADIYFPHRTTTATAAAPVKRLLSQDNMREPVPER